MTEQQAKKHKEVIKRFVEAPEKGIWCKTIGAIREWNLVKDPTFNENRIYVTNDEWADISKQFIDDRTKVEYKRFGNWSKTKSVDVEAMREQHIKDYRIKHAEPAFKEGDWVEYTTVAGKKKIYKIKSVYRNFDDTFTYSCENGVLDKTGATGFIEKWRPITNELVVFWNNNQNKPTYVIRMFNGIAYTENHKYFIDSEDDYWDNMAPIEMFQNIKGK